MTTTSIDDDDGAPLTAVRSPDVLERLGLVVLFLAGFVHWTFFFAPPSEPLRGPAFTLEDWPKEHRYYSVLQQAVRDGRVPFYISRPIDTRKFLAIPETLWSPQILLLRWTSVGAFVVMNTLLLYTAGFAGCVLLRRRHRLSFLPFAMLWLLFGFNGHLTAHLAVGHSMWAGELLLPFFFLCLVDLVEEPAREAPILKLALVLFTLSLQGAFHAYVWCLIFVGLVAVFDPRARWSACRAAAWAVALAACRLVPAVFLLNRRNQAFVSGFPSLSDLIHGLVTIRGASEAARGGAFGVLRWWEYDTYLGAAAVAWLAWHTLGPPRNQARPRSAALIAASVVMAALSFRDLYAPVNHLGFPLVSAERVSSRFLLLPVLALAVISAIRAQRHLETHPRAKSLHAAAVAVTALALLAHSLAWRVPRLEATLPPRSPNLEIGIVEQPEALHAAREVAYESAVLGSTLISLVGLGTLAARLRRERHAKSIDQPGLN